MNVEVSSHVHHSCRADRSEGSRSLQRTKLDQKFQLVSEFMTASAVPRNNLTGKSSYMYYLNLYFNTTHYGINSKFSSNILTANT